MSNKFSVSNMFIQNELCISKDENGIIRLIVNRGGKTYFPMKNIVLENEPIKKNGERMFGMALLTGDITINDIDEHVFFLVDKEQSREIAEKIDNDT